MNKNNDHVQTGARLGIGRTKVFELWYSGELASIKIGRKRFSTDRQIDDYLARLEGAA
ncbi:putative excision nuclease [Mycolicibacterium fortuitum]|uniref:Putative excision nuclease n=1 Tax=Mycolicibacterium fortuitum TaxID=1766 RepID=A0A378UXH0_MYCFO|nr:putative excision nuclease [Mycolicibacterium fortuitum]